ncbi:hypothetical protein [Kurthia sp. Dielmo]
MPIVTWVKSSFGTPNVSLPNLLCIYISN